MRGFAIAVLAGPSVLGIATSASAQTQEPRLADLKREQITDAQKRVYDAIAGGPRRGVPRASGT